MTFTQFPLTPAFPHLSPHSRYASPPYDFRCSSRDEVLAVRYCCLGELYCFCVIFPTLLDISRCWRRVLFTCIGCESFCGKLLRCFRFYWLDGRCSRKNWYSRYGIQIPWFWQQDLGLAACSVYCTRHMDLLFFLLGRFVTSLRCYVEGQFAVGQTVS